LRLPLAAAPSKHALLPIPAALPAEPAPRALPLLLPGAPSLNRPPPALAALAAFAGQVLRFLLAGRLFRGGLAPHVAPRPAPQTSWARIVLPPRGRCRRRQHQ